jgi:hypothetical protein
VKGKEWWRVSYRMGQRRTNISSQNFNSYSGMIRCISRIFERSL